MAPTDVDWVPIDPEGLKRIYDDLMQEYGVTVLFNTFLCDVDAENGEVHAIVTANKAGFTAYSAKTYIDCTGDGDLAVWAGARYEFEEDGEPMPSTLCFILSNVDLYAYLYHPKYGHRNGGIHPNNKKSFTHLLPNDDRFPEILIPFRRQLQIFKHSLNHSCSDQCICCVSSILLYLESDAGSVKSQI